MSLKKVEKMVDYLCHKAQFTNVTYYMTSFSLDEAADGLHYESEVIDGGSFAERMQRKINIERAEKEILNDYLLKDGTRFFNAIVATFIPNVEDDEGFLIEEELGMDFVKLSVKKDIKKFVLDGQHRLYALRKLREILIQQQKQDNDLKNIRIPIIFIVYSELNNTLEQKDKIREQIIRETRTVFTSLNKTAKPIDKYTALITDDGDLSAVSARKLLEENLLDENYIKWSIPSSSLGQTDPYFTTLSIINDFFDICESNFNESIDSTLKYEDRMSKVNELYFDFVEELGFVPSKLIIDFFNEISFFFNWKKNISALGIVLPKQPELPNLSADQKSNVKQWRQSNVLATVVGQKALFGAIVLSYNKMGTTTEEKNTNIFKRINILLELKFFDRNDKIWESILVRNDKNRSMITKTSNIFYAERLIELILTLASNSIENFSKDVYYELGTDRLDGHLNKYIDLLSKNLAT
ncbi:DNA sulfur modification protein DndB [Sulfuricurvum sp.]|uniref:DNA sulfur modification protein DndB n=1 Tax=Sulfuricurvum sp. TaxID=2025608 RepID=UPI002E343890|nr:DNA sulfur modification protein DndB [Sulfuricurvum sp.]HEX5329758.1 DNA sulfur modification protein DndB [Sulfuricurvum sp.]